MSKYNTLAKNTLVIGLGNMSTQLVGFLLLPIYTTFVSPGEYGTVDLIMTYIVLLVPLITVQIEMAVFRFLIDVRQNYEEVSRIITNGLASELILVAIFALVSYLINSLYPIPHYPLVLTLLIVTSLATLSLQAARGLGDNRRYAIASASAALATLVSAAVFVVILHWGAAGMLMASIMANTSIVLFLATRLRIGSHLDPRKLSLSFARSMTKYSAPLVPNGISLWVINASDRTIIAYILGASANGLYALASKIAFAVASAAGVFTLSWTESAAMHVNDPDRDKYFSDVMNTSINFFATVGLVVISVTPFVFTALIGAEFAEAQLLVPLLIVGTVLAVIMSLYGAIYIALKLSKSVANTSIFAAIINVVLTFGLVHQVGVYGAAIATIIAYLSMVIYRHFDIKKHIHVRYSRTISLFAVSYLIVGGLFYMGGLMYHAMGLAVSIALGLYFNQNILRHGLHYVRSIAKSKKGAKI